MNPTTHRDSAALRSRAMNPRHLLGLVLALGLCSSCRSINAPLEGPAWERFGEGATTMGVSTGWAFYEGKAKASGKSGVLTGDSGTDTATLDPNYGGAIKLHHMITDNVALGGIIEYRSFDPESLRPLTATLTAEDFETWHFIASTRYFFEGWGATRSWRPFLGVDLSYIPEVSLGNVDVDYPANTNLPNETVQVTGSDYWALGGVAGFSYMLYDDVAFDIGAFYEYALTTSDATVAFQNLGGAEAEMALRAQGLVFFVGLTYSF